MEKTHKHALNIIIADDDPDDQYMMQKTIWELNSNHRITCVYNGIQLLEYLLRRGAYKNCRDPKPDCIFLDLNMPLLTGNETLPMIRKNIEFEKTPVYIFTTCKCEDEKEKLLFMGANGVFTKSVNSPGMIKNVTDALKSIIPHAPSSTAITNKKR